MALAGQIALVTGASRGIEINERGGRGIALYVDHSNMDEVKKLFERIDSENNGKLDILVNNAYSAVQTIVNNVRKKFYECDPEIWDDINNVGLRNHYFCSVYAARLMSKNRQGLIVNVSSAGGIRYLFNVAYGVGKQAVDRMAADMAVELRKSNVCVISLWPGAVRTEILNQEFSSGRQGAKMSEMFEMGETTEYPGKAVVALAKDKNVMQKTGRILVTSDLGKEYGFVDIDGREPPSLRSLAYLLKYAGYNKTGDWIPEWVKLPGWFIWATTSRL